MNIFRLIARPLMASPFIVDGWTAITRPEEHVAKIKESGLLTENLPVVGTLTDDHLRMGTRIMGAVSVASGVALSVGRLPRLSAGALAIMSIPTALVNAPVWNEKTPKGRKDKAAELRIRTALTGAMIVAAFDRQGKPSSLWQLSNWRARRSELRAARQEVRNRYQAQLTSETSRLV